MGKWDSVVERLKKLPPEMEHDEDKGRDYQRRVDATKQTEEFRIKTAAALVQTYAKIRAEKDRAKDVVSAISLRLEACEQLVKAAYEAESITSMKIERNRADPDSLGGTLRTQPEPYSVVEDRDKLRSWALADEKRTKLLTIQWQTLNGVVKDMLEKGGNEPPGVTAYGKTKVVWTREK